MVPNRPHDLIEITVFNDLTICIQGKQATSPCDNIYKYIVIISSHELIRPSVVFDLWERLGCDDVVLLFSI